ncbi:hypothetical protein Pelo_10512 [Pelomyxa schiedti]|nr:hypothetical protein Pelo_10512 [Pelomyxa schiedti]
MDNAIRLGRLLAEFFKPLNAFALGNLRHEGQPLWQYRIKALRKLNFETKLRECLMPPPPSSGTPPPSPSVPRSVSVGAAAAAATPTTPPGRPRSDSSSPANASASSYEDNLFLAGLISRVSLPLIPTWGGGGGGPANNNNKKQHISISELTPDERGRLTDLAATSEYALSLLITLALRDPNDTWAHFTCDILGQGSWRDPQSDDVPLRLSNFRSLRECVHIDFTFCNFSGVPLRNTHGPIVFSGLSFFGTSFAGHRQLKWLKFSGCCMDHTNFCRCTINHSDFTGTSLMNSSFQGGKGNQVIFDWANLSQADMSMFNAKNPLFRYACLSGVDFSRAVLSGASMQAATLTSSILNNSELCDSNFEDTQGLTSSQLCLCRSIRAATVPRSLEILQGESLEALRTQLGFSFPETVRVDRTWIAEFLYNEVIASGGSFSPLWPPPPGTWVTDSNWLPPLGTVCSIANSEKLWQVLVYLIHGTSDTETYKSTYFEFSRLKKAAEGGNLLHFLQEETRQPPTHLGQAESITIHEIKVMNNPRLWQQYQEKKGDISVSLRARTIQSQASQIRWQAKLEGGLPVLNRAVGECWLFHGTSQSTMKKITMGGFSSKFATRKAGVGYGALGRGIYLSDSFAKVATYAKCESCTENNCNHLKAVFICRVTLGNIYVDRNKGRKFAEGPERGFHSSWGPNGAFDPESCFDSNEFCVPEEQVYPEFCVFYRDNQSLFDCDVSAQNVSTHIPRPSAWVTTVSGAPDSITQELKYYYRVLAYSDDITRRRELLYRLQHVCDKALLDTQQQCTQQVEVAIQQLQLKIAEEWSSITSCAADSSPFPMYILLKSRGDSFLFVQKWGNAVAHYAMALVADSFDDQDAEFDLNLAVAKYRHCRDTDSFVSLFSNAIRIDPGILVLAQPFMSQLEYTRINLKALVERSPFCNNPRCIEQILRDCCQLLCNEEIELEEFEEYYWKLSCEDRRKLSEHFYDHRRFPRIKNWFESVPLNSIGYHLSTDITKALLQSHLSELVAPPPLDTTKAVITWINARGTSVTTHLKDEYTAMLFEEDGSIRGNPSSLTRLIQKSDGQPIAHIKFYPTFPLRQLAAAELTYLLSGHGTVAIFARIVHPNRPREPYPVFLFMPTKGDPVNTGGSADRLVSTLHPKAFSWKVIETLLLQPQKDSAENMSIQDGWLVSQLTDSFMPTPLIRDGVCQLRSHIFCLPKMFDGNFKVHPHVISAFLELEPPRLLQHWWEQIQVHDRKIKELFGGFPALMEQHKMTSLLQISNLPNLAKRLQFLQHLLRSSSSETKDWTHRDMLNAFDPAMGKCYTVATGEWTVDCSTSFQRIPIVRSCLSSKQLPPFHTHSQEDDELYNFEQLGTYPITDICSDFLEAFQILKEFEKGVTEGFCGLRIAWKRQNLLNTTKFSGRAAVEAAPSLFQHCMEKGDQFTELSLVGVPGNCKTSLANLLEQSWKKLVHLRIDSCPLDSLPDFFLSLESLHILRCNDIQQITGKFPMLRVLVIKECTGMVALKITSGRLLKCVHVIQCESLVEFKLQIKENNDAAADVGDFEVFEIKECHKLDIPECFIPQFNGAVLRHFQVNNSEFWQERYKRKLAGTVGQDFNQASMVQQLEHKIVTPKAWKRLDDVTLKYQFILPLIQPFLRCCLEHVKKSDALGTIGLLFWKTVVLAHPAVIPATDLQKFVTTLRKEYRHPALPKALGHLLRNNRHLFTAEMLQELRGLLSDSNESVRYNAASLLVHSSSSNSLSREDINILWRDPSAKVRARAVQLFGAAAMSSIRAASSEPAATPPSLLETIGILHGPIAPDDVVTRKLCVTTIRVLELWPGIRTAGAEGILAKIFTNPTPGSALWTRPHTKSSSVTTVQWVLAEIIRLCCSPTLISKIFGFLLDCMKGKDRSTKLSICNTIVVVMGRCSMNENIKQIVPNETIASVIEDVRTVSIGLASEIVEMNTAKTELSRTNLVDSAKIAPFDRIADETLGEQLKVLEKLDRAPSPEWVVPITRVITQGRGSNRRHAANLLAKILHSTGQIPRFMEQHCSGPLEIGHVLLISKLIQHHSVFYSPRLENDINLSATTALQRGDEESEHLLSALGAIFSASHPPNTECRAHPTRDIDFLINLCEHFSPFGPDASIHMDKFLEGWAGMVCMVAKTHHQFAARYCKKLITEYLVGDNVHSYFVGAKSLIFELFKLSPESEQQVLLTMLTALPKMQFVLLGNILKWSCHFSSAPTFIAAVKAISEEQKKGASRIFSRLNSNDQDSMTCLGTVLSAPFLDYIKPTLDELDLEPIPPDPENYPSTNDCSCEWCGGSFCGCHFCGSKYCSPTLIPMKAKNP